MSLLTRFRRGVPDGPLDCRAVGRVLQRVLDGEDDGTIGERVAAHLDACRDCGLEADTYLRIKSTLARSAPLDGGATERLRAFGEALARQGPPTAPLDDA